MNNARLELESRKTPRSEFPYVCLGLLLKKQGASAEARELLEQGQQRNPGSSWANCELGRFWLTAKKLKSAEHYLERAETLDSTFSRVHFMLGRLYQQTNKPEHNRRCRQTHSGCRSLG